MKKTLLPVCLLVLLGIGAFAHAGSQVAPNGTLSITMGAAPAGGLSTPRVVVMQSFHSMVHNTLNWGDTWGQSLPSGNYQIMSMPVTGGGVFYMANSIFVTVPPGGTVTPTITYHAV